MKLGPVTKLDERNKTMSKMFDYGAMSRNLPISRNGEAGLQMQSVKLIFSLIVTFYLAKTETVN